MHLPTLAGPRRRTRRAVLAAALPAVLAAVALPAAAQASSVVLSGGELQYFQTTNQPNSVVLRNVGNTIRVENSTGITAFPSGCQRVFAEEISCPVGLAVRASVQLATATTSTRRTRTSRLRCSGSTATTPTPAP